MNTMLTSLLSVQLFAEALAIFNVYLDALMEKALCLLFLGPKPQLCSLVSCAISQYEKYQS